MDDHAPAPAVAESDLDPPAAARSTLLARLLPLAVFVVAAGARLAVIFRGAGLHGDFGYDAPVYFADGDALLHGRMPYSGFVMLHPPLIMLVLAPFSLITRFASDDTALAVATVAFCLLGALNAVLVMRLSTALGLGRWPAAAGGMFYALWYGAVGAEDLTKLETLGNTLLLLAMLAVVRAERTSSWRFSIVAGAMLGLLISVKIWWVVPLAVIAAWHLWRMRRWSTVGQLLAGLASAAAVVDLPFFLHSPRAMWDSVVTDQLGRPRTYSLLFRIGDLASVRPIRPALPHAVTVPLVSVIAVAFLWLAARAAAVPSCRPSLVLLAVQLVVLFVSPSWFTYYCDYVAVPAAIVIAGAAARSSMFPRRGVFAHRLVAFAPVGAAAVLTWIVLGSAANVVPALPGAAALTRAAAHVKCVMADEPMAQIEVDALSRGLAAGCRNWIDDTGPTYGRDKATGADQRRSKNLRWQRDLTNYLRSGGAIMILRRDRTGISPASWRAIKRDGVLARAGGQTLWRVRH